MLHNKFQCLFISLDEIHAALVAHRVDAELVAIGLEFVHLLAKGVIDTHRAKVFAADSHEIVSGIREEGEALVMFFNSNCTKSILAKVFV